MALSHFGARRIFGRWRRAGQPGGHGGHSRHSEHGGRRLTAREFGGTRQAQLLAAAGTALAPWLLASDELANTTPYALLAWAGLALIVVRIGRTGDCRWWLAGGLVAGLGVADDHSMAFFAIALVIGALVSRGGRLIWNGWFLAGAVLAVAFEVPDLWWQAQHHWATIAMTESLHRENGGPANIGPWVLQQVAIAAVTLPVLPAAVFARTVARASPNLPSTIGWPRLVRTVDAAWTALPPGQRASAVIFTDVYGEAGAINELGRGTGLPTAVSSQNSEWWWGPGNPRATTIIAVAPGPVDHTAGFGARLGQFFTSVRVVATLSSPYGVRNQEQGGHVYICTGPRQPWSRIWPQLRHYD